MTTPQDSGRCGGRATPTGPTKDAESGLGGDTGAVSGAVIGSDGIPRWHLPEITDLRAPGHWGVFCQACSHEAGDYVYPCPGWTENVPPATLRAVDA